MKRCYICNYRARTLDRLTVDYGQSKRYVCRDEFRDKCREKAKRVRAKNNQREA